MKKKFLYAAAAALAIAALSLGATAARAGTTFDTTLAAPGVYFGTGNFNTGYAVTTMDGVELGLKSKINKDPNDTVQPVGDLYSIGLGNKVNFDYAVNADINGGTPVDLSGATATLTILNVATNQTFTFDPSSHSVQLGDTFNAATGGYQNSEQIGFFPVGFGLATNATYDITLALSNVGANHDAFSVTDVVKYGAGGVPEPASWAMMLVGFGGLGAMLRRRRSQTAVMA